MRRNNINQAREKALNGICPICDKGPFVSVAAHANPKHGIDRFQLKDMLGMYYQDPLCSPELSERHRERGKRIYEEGKSGITSGQPGIPHKLSKAAVRLQKEKSAKITPASRLETGRRLSEKLHKQNAERDTRIVAMMNQGATNNQIAKKVGLTTQRIGEIGLENGIGDGRKRYWTKQQGIDRPTLQKGRETIIRRHQTETIRMIEAYESGATIAQLALEKNVNEVAVKARLRKAGIELPDGRSDPSRRKPPPRQPAPPRYCDMEGCHNLHRARGLCGKHYQRIGQGR